ncbi:MAG: class I SAM-dependent methyltransferase [Rubrivivax sp.]|nr:class I SAM-dependent methyltransferase [Rubrivivax sp.]
MSHAPDRPRGSVAQPLSPPPAAGGLGAARPWGHAADPAGPGPLAEIRQRQQATWASGDYAVIGTTLQIVGERLAEAADIRAGEHVLDVAAGNGNATLAAARRGADVLSTDYVPALLDRGRARAAAEGLAVRFVVADAESLPCADGACDAVLSTFGAMFAPDAARAAAELLRVTRRGGRIGLASWTPGGFVGRLFEVLAAHVPPPPALAPPVRWGSEEHLQALLAAGAGRLRARRRMFHFRYRSAAHWLQVFATCYGPMTKAFEALDEPGRAALAADITALLDAANTGGAGTLVVPAEYLEVVIERA